MMASVVVVAKCPVPGKSKTRLSPLLGDNGAATLAKAMLCDVLTNLSQNHDLKEIKKILLYAPPNPFGFEVMEAILEEIHLYEHTHTQWDLLPMLTRDLNSSSLGSQLEDALIRTRHLQSGPVIFIGMDSPELPIDEIISACRNPEQALLCPSADGGYGLLSVPQSADASKVFADVRWSDSLTAVSQLKALTDAGVPVRIGRLMNDIDTPEDVQDLCERLSVENTNDEQYDCLQVSTLGYRHTAKCTFTKLALQNLGLLNVKRHD